MSEIVCTICSGIGEIETEIDGDTITVGCPECIERDKDSEIADLELILAAKEFDEAPDSAIFREGHPVFKLAQKNDNYKVKIAELEKRVAELELDAKRLDWLEQSMWYVGSGYDRRYLDEFPYDNKNLGLGLLRVTIDAAIAQEKGNE